MRLTQWTDYALRLLMYCAVHQQRERPITISEVAQVHNISRSHLTKIVQDPAGRGLLETTRGRGGGICCARRKRCLWGTVVRATENRFRHGGVLQTRHQCLLSEQQLPFEIGVEPGHPGVFAHARWRDPGRLVADADAAALMRSAAGQPTIQPLIAFPRVRDDARMSVAVVDSFVSAHLAADVSGAPGAPLMCRWR